MKRLNVLLVLCLLAACKKGSNQNNECDIEQIKIQNAARVTINNGVWGTLFVREGNCMPTFGKTTCRQCPAKHEVRIYEYATRNDVIYKPGVLGLERIKTALVKTVTTDNNGFYQTEIPDGQYTIVMVEDGRLYPSSVGSENGISCVQVQQNKAMFNIMINRAVD